MTTDTRKQYCFTHSCQSRNDCLYPHIHHPEGLYFFGKGRDKKSCEDFVELTSENKPNATDKFD
jgi:hypothetical protein